MMCPGSRPGPRDLAPSSVIRPSRKSPPSWPTFLVHASSPEGTRWRPIYPPEALVGPWASSCTLTTSARVSVGFSFPDGYGTQVQDVLKY